MLEYWNDGIMGYGKLGYWVYWKNILIRKLINEKLFIKINIPIFHHSIIPWLG